MFKLLLVVSLFAFAMAEPGVVVAPAPVVAHPVVAHPVVAHPVVAHGPVIHHHGAHAVHSHVIQHPAPIKTVVHKPVALVKPVVPVVVKPVVPLVPVHHAHPAVIAHH